MRVNLNKYIYGKSQHYYIQPKIINDNIREAVGYFPSKRSAQEYLRKRIKQFLETTFEEDDERENK